ncbi:MAG: Ig-like domain-containing protein, partial [Coprobacillus sp.]|nr:Ig-like domain-containing protein [Coprobacillus sp.]
MRKRQLTLLGSLLCVLALTACNVEVNIDGDVNANIDTSIDLDDDTGDDTGSDTGEDESEDSDTKENIPTEITLSLTPSTNEVTVGDSVDISFSTSPQGVTVTFSSSDTSLATVTNNGHVTTLAPGTVTITAVASLDGYNDVSKDVVITINPVIDEGGDSGSGGT